VRDGSPTRWSGVTTLHKTNQQRPGKSTWKLWSCALDLIAKSNNKLYVLLRQWIVPPSRQRQRWPVYYDPDHDALFFGQAGGYRRHDCFNHMFSYIPTLSCQVLSEWAYPVSLRPLPLGWAIIRYTSYCPTLPQSPPTCFRAYCNLLPDGKQECSPM
jgi:hypothetical protein